MARLVPHPAASFFTHDTLLDACVQVGGLGDVVTALGRAVQEQGHLVEVVVPRYEFFSYSPVLSNQLR